MNKKIIIGLVIFIVIVGIVLGFTLVNRNKNHALEYRKEAIERGDIQAVVVTTGSLNPVTIADVGSQVSGRIEKLYADFNSKVKEGQVIAKLDPIEALRYE